MQLLEQEKMSVEVCQKCEQLKSSCESLRGSASLLSDQQSAEEVFGNIDSVSAHVQRLVFTYTLFLELKSFMFS